MRRVRGDFQDAWPNSRCKRSRTARVHAGDGLPDCTEDMHRQQREAVHAY